MNAKGYRAFAKAYNNDEDIAKNYASIGMYLNLTLSKKTFSEIEKSKLNFIKSNLEYEKNLKDLKAKEVYYKNVLSKINKAIKLAINSINLKQKLLESARIAFSLNRMSVDEYLGYEDELVKAKANLFNLKATKNMLIANLAFIYGENLKKVFK